MRLRDEPVQPANDDDSHDYKVLERPRSDEDNMLWFWILQESAD